MDIVAGRNLRTTPRRRLSQAIGTAHHGTRTTRRARAANAQGRARRDLHTKTRRAWDVGSRNAADSATLAARASETTRVVTGAGVLRPEHVAAVMDALMYEHRLNTIVTCSCCDCRISVVEMDGRLFRRDQPPASTLLRDTVVPKSPPIDCCPLSCVDFANGHDVLPGPPPRSSRPRTFRVLALFLLAARSRGQRLAAAGVVADHGLPGLHRPGSRATST